MKNLLATLTLGLSGAVLFSACAPGQYVQDRETDDLYFTANDRNTVEITQTNPKITANYDKDGSYVYQEEVASKNFNPDAVDVNRYTSENNTEASGDGYYIPEEERAFDDNQFNQANYASFGNPAFARARMWNDPFFNPMWGGGGFGRMGMMGMGGFGNPYMNSMAFYDPFFDPYMMGGPMGFDPFFGPGAWGMRPGLSINFGFGFGNAFAFGSPWGFNRFNRWNRWNRFGGFGGFGGFGYNAGFYDGLAFGNPYNRFGFCPPAVVAVRNDYIAANQRRVTRGTTARTSRAVRQNVDRRSGTRTRNSYTASRNTRDAYNARSKNSLYQDQGRARSRVSTPTTRSRVAPSTTRSSRSYDPNRVQRQRSTNSYGTRQRSSAPSMRSRSNSSGSSRSYGSSSYGSRNQSNSYGRSSSSGTRSRSYSPGSSGRSSSSYSRSSGSSSRGSSSRSSGGRRP